MNLRLVREPTRLAATLGVLFVDGAFECFTLEDAERDIKVAGVTAIPSGRYEVKVTYSPRFKRQLPLLLNVPGFTGIRIHPGNTDKDTEGCILPGRVRRGNPPAVLESRLAFEPLLKKLQASRGPIWIDIESWQPPTD